MFWIPASWGRCAEAETPLTSPKKKLNVTLFNVSLGIKNVLLSIFLLTCISKVLFRMTRWPLNSLCMCFSPSYWPSPLFPLALSRQLIPDLPSRCMWMSNVLLFPPASRRLCSICAVISPAACCFFSPAYNWIWVWDRRAVGSEIKEGRLSLHLRRGTP